MNILQKAIVDANGMENEIEINICFHKSDWAIPFFISWWDTKVSAGRLTKSLDFSIHFLCFSLHFTHWKWRDDAV